MTPRKDVANNIEQAAQDLMIYLLTFSNEEARSKLQKDLDHILDLAKEEYTGENMSYFSQYFILPFSRQRSDQLKQAIAKSKASEEDLFARFVILVDLLSNGACKSTSLNTIILDKLIAATEKYNPINEDKLNKAESDNVTTRERLRDFFLQKACPLIEQKTAEKKQEDERKALAEASTKNEARKTILLQERKDYKDIIAKLNDFLLDRLKKTGEKKADESDDIHRAKSAPIDIKKVKIKETDKFPVQQAMLLEAFARHKEKEKEKKKTTEQLKPLAVSYEETVVVSLNSDDKSVEAPASIPLPPRPAPKFAGNETLANASANLAVFFKAQEGKKLATAKAKKSGLVKKMDAAVAKGLGAKL